MPPTPPPPAYKGPELFVFGNNYNVAVLVPPRAIAGIRKETPPFLRCSVCAYSI